MADDVAEDEWKASYVNAPEQPPPPMKLGFGYVNQQTGIANAAPVDTDAEMRQYHLSHCVQILQEAAKIRKDDALMKEIREFVRRQRDDLALMLDTIG